jgi:chorismate mutase
MKDTYMSFETNTATSNTTTTQSTEAAITAATEKLIATACAKHNITPEQLPQDSIDYARRTAREMVESDQRNQQNEYYHLYLQEKQAREAAEAANKAVRDNHTARADTRTVTTMERTRDLMGRAAWFQLTEAQKISALGVDPATVDKQLLRTLFGKNTDTAAAVDYAKANPYKYKQFREVSLALDITGK